MKYLSRLIVPRLETMYNVIIFPPDQEHLTVIPRNQLRPETARTPALRKSQSVLITDTNRPPDPQEPVQPLPPPDTAKTDRRWWYMQTGITMRYLTYVLCVPVVIVVDTHTRLTLMLLTPYNDNNNNK